MFVLAFCLVCSVWSLCRDSADKGCGVYGSAWQTTDPALSFEPMSKLLVSPLITLIMLLYIINPLYPPF